MPKGTVSLVTAYIFVLTGGKLLLAFKQESPADHVENEDVLKALGLAESRDAEGGEAEGATGGQAEGATGEQPSSVVCEEDVCKKV